MAAGGRGARDARDARETRYILDTQFYVDVLRGAPGASDTLRLLAARVAAVDFHALVGAELLIGAVDAAAAAAIRRSLVDRFKPARVLVPDCDDVLAAGDALRALREKDGAHPEHERRSFWNDVLIAVSCRRRGRVLVSRDRDHDRIALVVKHRVVASLPEL
ncbi:PilT protein domain protein (plasmid) [Gemmatirosa kalamazoonensis]|uniref:Ribonuclease VapC n=1 Tax=Gemmatirosa kalamazoonensis TaxID=861299 RepID=W0RSJ6_9BACT|nr:PIN domain-containing protein [Gemmatirosa kalamazoonensis]AHG93270.1 PilT protein domain protein [Gemmatirosa kalamazoonensis]